jgi:beta-glucosidase
MLWYPGMEGGRALADVLLGRVNPTGRLPFAVPTDATHLPDFDRDATTATYGLFHGQWLLDRDGHDARYPFGYGLSYASAAIEDAHVGVELEAIIARTALRNDGARDATEVVQVYAGARGSAVERPKWRLAAFARVDVPARSTASFELSVPLERVAIRSHGQWIVEPCVYEVAVGLRARDPAARVFRIELPAASTIG